MPTLLTRGIQFLAASLLPQPCAVCGRTAGFWPICTDCFVELPRTPASCQRCGDSLPDYETSVTAFKTTNTNGACASCLSNPPPYARTIAAFTYRTPVDRLITDLKFRAQLQLAPWFAEQLLVQVRARAADCDLIVPMPLHPNRLRERGFNQAREIAVPLSRWLGKPLGDGICARVRPTAHQIDLDADTRLRNVRGAFACAKPLNGQHLLVVDDVMTTGATLAELARTLIESGAGEVSVAVAARTPQR